MCCDLAPRPIWSIAAYGRSPAHLLPGIPSAKTVLDLRGCRGGHTRPPRKACRQQLCRIQQHIACTNGSGVGAMQDHAGARPANLLPGQKAARLRQLLAGDTCVQAPACYDGLSARLVAEAGFPVSFLSGFSVAAGRAGCPDTGLLSFAEVLDSARCAVEAAPGVAIIADGDTGYGNAMNVKRTVRGFANAGLAGVLIEDQVWPKSCGHVRGKKVIPRDEAVARVRAACDARDEGLDILILARTDARQAASLDEALARITAFAEAGADILFIDALASVDEMKALGSLPGAAAGVPKMANNLEGGGKTPILPPAELKAMGFALVAYPLSLMGVAAAAMRKALQGIRHDGSVPTQPDLPTFQDLQEIVGFPEYFEEEARYAVSEKQ